MQRAPSFHLQVGPYHRTRIRKAGDCAIGPVDTSRTGCGLRRNDVHPPLRRPLWHVLYKRAKKDEYATQGKGR